MAERGSPTPPTVHPDNTAGLGDSEAAPGKINTDAGGGESSGGAYQTAPTPANRDGDTGGQSQQGYSGGDNPNATSTRDASHDRAA